MTKLCWSLIKAENDRRGLKYPQVGAITTAIRGFRDGDTYIGEIINEGGGVSYVSAGNARAFRKYLAKQEEFRKLDALSLELYDRPFCELDVDYRIQLRQELADRL